MQDPKTLALYFEADDKRMNFLKAVLPIYIQELNKAGIIVNKYYEEKNDKLFLATIHKMKGSALTFGAKPISSECIEIEEKYAENKDLTKIEIKILLKNIKTLNEIYSAEV